MFTGIIECMGIIRSAAPQGTGRSFWISATIAPELRPDQSLSHNGTCLTVEAVDRNRYRVTAVEETLQKTTLSAWNVGDEVNLERCLALNGRLDGHLVQGHIDTVATCTRRTEKSGSHEFEFEFPEEFTHLVVEKGSISLDGISLTVFNVRKTTFAVAVIPYTFGHTNIHKLQKGSKVNLEFDIIGKYVSRMDHNRKKND